MAAMATRPTRPTRASRGARTATPPVPPPLPAAILDPRVRDLLQTATTALRTAKIAYAVGGGVAVNAYGFPYQTHDVDLFFPPGAQNAACRVLRKAGLTVREAMAPFHYTAHGPGASPASPVRIDALFSADDLELAALSTRCLVVIDDVACPMFRSDYLAAVKFMADRPGKDRPHLAAMYQLGAISPSRVHTVLREAGEREAARAWREFIVELKAGMQGARGQRGWRKLTGRPAKGGGARTKRAVGGTGGSGKGGSGR